MAKRIPQRAPRATEHQNARQEQGAQGAVATLEREPGQQTAGMPQPDDIARRAYEIYCGRGCENGRDMDDWLQAERELRQQR